MRIYGKDIDIQGEGANANISLSFSRTNMFSFGMDIPKCQILQPPITPMADYCCKYPAVIAGGVGLPVMNVCVNAISKNSVNLCIETAANGDVPIYELFKDNIICGCCRPVTPAVTDALHGLGMCVEFIPQYSNVDACVYGGYAVGCLMHEPITWSEVCEGDFALCRSCYGIVCPLELDLPSDYVINICGARACSGDPAAPICGVGIDVNDFTFAWKWNNFIECASCWWECHCGVPITGAPMLADDVVIVMPNTRESYLCAPWSMSEGAACTYCEYLAPKCVFDAGCMPRALNLSFATWAIDLCGSQFFMIDALGNYIYDGATHIGGVDVAMPLVVSLYRNGSIYRSRVAFCGDYITCAQVMDIMSGIGLCCNVIYSEVASLDELQYMSVPVALTPSCYDVCLIAFAVDTDCNCHSMYGNLMRGTTSLVSSDFHCVRIDGGWTTRQGQEDSMCYGCVCLPWIGNFFGCGVIDTIRRVVTTLGCYMNGADVYSPSGKTFAINCALDYCVYNCSTFQVGYTTEPSECYISCNSGNDGVEPLLGVLQNVGRTGQFWRMCYPIIDPYSSSAQYISVPFTFSSLLPPHTGITEFGWHAQLAGCCSLICPSCYNTPTYLCGCVGSINDYCCRTEVAIARMLYNVECGYIMPVVCGDYNKPYIAAQLCYEQRVHLDLNACYCYKWYDGGGCEHYTNIPWVMLTYDILCGCENTAPIGCCSEIPMLRWLCQPSKTGVRNNAVTLTTQPSDTNTILSNGVGSCFTWHGSRYRIEKIDNYNPSAATCLKVFGIMV